jgi:hypothetical protein
MIVSNRTTNLPDFSKQMNETNQLMRKTYAAMGYDVDKPMDRSVLCLATFDEKNAQHEEFHRRVEELFGEGK